MYKKRILNLIQKSPLEIDTEIQITGRPPTMANSEFLTNKEQGDWAEQVVYKAINECSRDFFAVKYGRSESIAAGDDGFADFYVAYQHELNTIGKKPDILIFKSVDFPERNVSVENDEHIKKAIAALEVRSSSFLSDKYAAFMLRRQEQAINQCRTIRDRIISGEVGPLLERKNKTIYNLILNATDEMFKELDFRRPSWSSTQELKHLSQLLKDLKEKKI